MINPHSSLTDSMTPLIFSNRSITNHIPSETLGRMSNVDDPGGPACSPTPSSLKYKTERLVMKSETKSIILPKMSGTRKIANQAPFVPGSPPKPGFSIRAFVARKPHKEKCMICLESSFHCDFKSLGCNHRFHAHCIATMLNKGSRTCPLCRANINDS